MFCVCAGIEEDFALLELQLQAISAASSAGTKPVETTAQLVAGFDAVGDLAYRAQLLPPVRAAVILSSLEECRAACSGLPRSVSGELMISTLRHVKLS